MTALVFVLSRLIARFHLGLRFDHGPVAGFIQYLDPWYLHHDFWRSLLYLHHQAPLQNALVGAALRFFSPRIAFQMLDAIYVALGLCLVLSILHAMLRLGAGTCSALLVTMLFTLTPATLLYENWLMYHLPVACCLVLSLLALLRYLRVGTVRAGFVFFGLIALAALFRATLGCIFLAAAVVLLLVYPPPVLSARAGARKTVLQAAAVPLCVLCLNSCKPSLLIGYGYGEALLWGNLSTKIFTHLHPYERERLTATGALSRGVGHFCLDQTDCIAELRVAHSPTGVPILDDYSTPNGFANAHAIEHLMIARKFHKPDALFMLSHYPDAYLRSVGAALAQNTASSTNDDMLPKSANYRRLRRWDEAAQKLAGRNARGELLLLVIGLPALIAYATVRILAAGARRRSQRVGAVALIYLLFVIAYVTVATTAISYGDFSRYRYEVDPLYVVLAGLLISDLTRAFRASLLESLLLRVRRQSRASTKTYAKPDTNPNRVLAYLPEP